MTPEILNKCYFTFQVTQILSQSLSGCVSINLEVAWMETALKKKKNMYCKKVALEMLFCIYRTCDVQQSHNILKNKKRYV